MTTDGRWTYTWDAENRLIRVQSRSDTPQASWRRVEWQYDALGRRIRQTTWMWNTNSGTWQVTEDLKFISDPLLFGRHIVELNGTDNSRVRSYVWGLDLSESMDSAGGAGGLLWVTLPTASGSAGGTHFAAYDGNGNVVALVSATTGTDTARYEYGPFGEPLRVTGPAAYQNPFRFSTKRTCNATDLVLYEYRAYNHTLGRWLNRDFIGEEVGANLNVAFNNSAIEKFDIFGLWDSFIHRDHTILWAATVGYPPEAARAVGQADDAVDRLFGSTSYVFEPGTMYHFDRSLSMGYSKDTRLMKSEEHLSKARALCTIAIGNDNPKAAAKELGTALHPLQDWVAHGDHNMRLLGSFRLHPAFMHNYMSPANGSERFPDNPLLDAVGSSDGRPTLSVLHFVTHPLFPPPTYIFDWADYQLGLRRLVLTMELSVSTLSEFRSYVGTYGGCLCKEYFGVQ